MFTQSTLELLNEFTPCMFTGSLDDVLTDALVKNKVKFVELILQQGVVMKEYLTVERLEKLYLEVNTLICSKRTHFLGL